MILDLDALTARIRDVAGADLDRVILHGSHAWGSWDPESSDIDVAVLIRDCDSDRRHEINKVLNQALRREPTAFGEAADRVELSVRPAADFFALREFHPCMESKTLRLGKVLWIAPDAHDWPVLPVEEARAYVVRRGVEAARRNINVARMTAAIDRGGPETLGWNWSCSYAYAAACLVLRAALYSRDIDPSDKSIRWSVQGLSEQLGLSASAALPDDYYSCDCNGPPDKEISERDARGAIAAAARIYQGVQQEIGAQPLRKWSSIRAEVAEYKANRVKPQ